MLERPLAARGVTMLFGAAADGFDRRGDRVMAANTSAGGEPPTPRGEPLVGRAARGPRNLLLNTGTGRWGSRWRSAPRSW